MKQSEYLGLEMEKISFSTEDVILTSDPIDPCPDDSGQPCPYEQHGQYCG